ncbi:hypothetical protein BC629DRAFT_1439910 [Irpex lacteus]|nr:hypothetical protein BC629DRAFT_1439910 [Irpex lacteus]
MDSLHVYVHKITPDSSTPGTTVRSVVCSPELAGERMCGEMRDNKARQGDARAPCADNVQLREGQEARIQDACRYLRKQKHVSMLAASSLFKVPYSTLRRRYKKINCLRPDGHKKQRTLSKAEEKVLVIWLQFWSAQGTPVSQQGVRFTIPEVQRRIVPVRASALDNCEM